MLAAIVAGSLLMTACEKDGPDSKDNNQSVTLQCVKPDYLKAGDKVALISPSYHTPMENVEKTADVLRGWGLVSVIGPNVGKIDAGNTR